MSTVVVSLLAALLSLAIRHVRVLHGLNLVTMTGPSLICRFTDPDRALCGWGPDFEPVRGLMDSGS
jgi:hypothetical protein